MNIMIKRFFSYFPSNLPVGLSEFNVWVDDVIELSGEFADKDSMVQALANMILHISPLKGTDTPRDRVPKNHFVKALRKGAANQVASFVFQDLRLKAAERIETAKKAELELNKGEVTAGQLVPGNGQA